MRWEGKKGKGGKEKLEGQDGGRAFLKAKE